MNSLDLIIKESLKPDLQVLSKNKNHILTEHTKQVDDQIAALKFLYEFHLKHIGPIHPVERLALKEQMVRVKQKSLLTEQIAPRLPKPDSTALFSTSDSTTAPTISTQQFADSLVDKTNTVRANVDTLKTFILQSKQIQDKLNYQQILNQQNQQDFEQAWRKAGTGTPGTLTTGAFNGRKLSRWSNRAADELFHSIIEKDPSFNSNKTGNLVFSGFQGDVRNEKDQIYNYAITAQDEGGKSICIMIFYPNGNVGITPDLAPVSMQKGKSMLRWRLNGDVVEIISNTEEAKPVLLCTAKQYVLICKVNPEIVDKNYDPFKGEIFTLRAAFLSLKGYEQDLDNMYATQQQYDASDDSMMDTVQSIADWAGLIPGWGDIIDLVNGLVYWLRNKPFEACLSWIAMIPVVGSVISKGLRGFFNSLKFGGKNGIQILNSFIRSGGGLTGLFKGLMQAIAEYLKKNKAQRKQVLEWFKKMKSIGDVVMSTIRGIRDWCKDRFGFNWIAEVLTTMEAKLSDLPKTLGDMTTTMEDVVNNLDTANAIIVSAKAEQQAAEKLAQGSIRGGRNKVVKDALMNLVAKAPSLALNSGFMNRFFYRILGPKWWDAYARSITYSFIKYAQRDTRKFIATIATTPEGRNIIKPYLRELIGNKETLSALFKQIPDLARSASAKATANQQANLVIKYFDDLPETEIASFFENIRTVLYSGGTGALANTGKNMYSALVNNVIIDCVKQGSAMFRIFCESTWSSLRAAMPDRIAQFTEAKGLPYLKYDFTGGFNPVRNVSTAVTKWIAEATTGWGALNFIPTLINGVIKTLTELFNTKRLDVYYNELRDYFEKLGIDDDNIDEVNGFTFGAISGALIWGFKLLLPETVVDAARSLVSSLGAQVQKKQNIDLERYGAVDTPKDLDFVETGEFATKFRDVTPTQKTKPVSRAQRAKDSTDLARFKTY